MGTISKINSVAAGSISELNGIVKSSIAKLNGQDFKTSYVSSGLEFHVNANDTNSWNGTATWTDLAGVEDMTLVNGPTKASGDEYVAFDGNDDRGEIDWISSDYLFGGTSDYTFWNAMSIQVVLSWPEDGTTGFVHGDAVFLAGNRHQVSPNRGFRYLIGRNIGIGFDLFYGTRIDFRFPNTSDFQYNSTRAGYEPIPDRVYSIAVTFDRTTTPHISAYINGSLFTPSSFVGSGVQVTGTSQATSSFINNTNVRKGRVPWYINQSQNSNGTITSSSQTANVHEIMLFNRQISASEVQQNLDAYTDRYGALN